MREASSTASEYRPSSRSATPSSETTSTVLSAVTTRRGLAASRRAFADVAAHENPDGGGERQRLSWFLLVGSSGQRSAGSTRSSHAIPTSTPGEQAVWAIPLGDGRPAGVNRSPSSR